jgi:hypothetical protein
LAMLQTNLCCKLLQVFSEYGPWRCGLLVQHTETGVRSSEFESRWGIGKNFIYIKNVNKFQALAKWFQIRKMAQKNSLEVIRVENEEPHPIQKTRRPCNWGSHTKSRVACYLLTLIDFSTFPFFCFWLKTKLCLKPTIFCC